MSSTPRHQISDILRGLATPGSFTTRHTARVSGLSLAVTGVGDVALPVAAEQAKQLRSMARPAKYGHGTDTVLDRSVRDCWEIPKSRVRIDGQRWQQTLKPILDEIRDDLGLPSNSRLTAQLHSMLLYEEGHFFAPHQDSEKDDDMIATMVVVLPSSATGGDLVVQHNGETVRHRWSRSALTVVAFYADTRHEVLPLKSGHRIALTYNLSVNGGTAPDASIPDSLEPNLVKLLERHFNELPKPRWSGDTQAQHPPDRLVVFLDHQYTEHGLRWSQLKGDDTLRAAMLRRVAERHGYQISLAAAEIHECRECYGDDRSSRYGDYWEDSGPRTVVDSSRYDIGELLDNDITITPRDTSAALFDPYVPDSEIAEVTPTSALAAHDTEYTGYMGNYGNTMDRWYRRGAIVMWPASRTFALTAAANPIAALDDLSDRTIINEADRHQLVTDVETFLRFWSESAHREVSSETASQAFNLAVTANDPSVAARLVEPISVETLDPSHAISLIALAEHFGEPWFVDRATQWFATSVNAYYQHGNTPRARWLNQLDDICAQLMADEGGRPLGRSIADDFAKRSHSWIIDALVQTESITAPSQQRAARTELAGPIAALLRTCAITGNALVRDAALTHLLDQRVELVGLSVDVLNHLDPLPNEQRAWTRLDDLRDGVVAVLNDELSRPARQPDDWSISTLSEHQGCADCETLNEFLNDRERRAFTWPLAQARRQHIHGRIDKAELPVTHVTKRTGRPYQLVLTKTDELHQQEIARRAAALETLQKHTR